MRSEAIRLAVCELFAICAAAAALETLTHDERSGPPFRAVCALAATLCAMRALQRLLA